jgi:hypothetical protein
MYTVKIYKNNRLYYLTDKNGNNLFYFSKAYEIANKWTKRNNNQDYLIKSLDPKMPCMYRHNLTFNILVLHP